MTRVLYFTDAHVGPDSIADRLDFQYLGNLIVKERPDVIVQGGDFATLDSLSGWDKDKRKLMEGRRYKMDIDSCKQAMTDMFVPLWLLQKRQRENKKSVYRPALVWLEGNHENWLHKYVDLHPEIEGMMNLQDDLKFPRDMFSSFQYVTYKNEQDKNVVFVDGVAFTHAPRNRGGIISSKYICDRALSESFDCSVVFGHTHRFQVSSVARFGEKHEVKFAINGGCFFRDTPEYAKNNSNDYWKGCFIFNIDNGNITIEKQISLDELERNYAD